MTTVDCFVATVRSAALARTLCACGALTLALFAGTLPAFAQTVAYYRFDDGAAGSPATTITDSGANALTGTVVTNGVPVNYSSSVASFASTLGGNSLDLSGDLNHVRVPHSAAMEVQGDLTVELFLRPSVPYGGTSFGDDTLISKSNTTGAGAFLSAFAMQYNSSNGQVSATIGFGSTGDGASITPSTAFDLRDGAWHHAALVLDRDVSGTTDSATLFVDGVQIGQTLGTFPNLGYGTEPLYIGAGNFATPTGTGSFRRNFGGSLDEVRVTSGALAPGQFLNAVTVVPEAGTGALVAGVGACFAAGFVRRRGQK